MHVGDDLCGDGDGRLLGDAVVVSVEHRPAPEHPYPAPVEDVYAGLLWIAEHAKEIGRPAAAQADAAVPDAGRPRRHSLRTGWRVSASGPASPTRAVGARCWATGEAARTCPRTPPRPMPETRPGFPGLPRRRFRRDLPVRDGRLRLTGLAGRRGGRTACVVRRFPRLRGLRPPRSPGPPWAAVWHGCAGSSASDTTQGAGNGWTAGGVAHESLTLGEPPPTAASASHEPRAAEGASEPRSARPVRSGMTAEQ